MDLYILSAPNNGLLRIWINELNQIRATAHVVYNAKQGEEFLLNCYLVLEMENFSRIHEEDSARKLGEWVRIENM